MLNIGRGSSVALVFYFITMLREAFLYAVSLWLTSMLLDQSSALNLALRAYVYTHMSPFAKEHVISKCLDPSVVCSWSESPQYTLYSYYVMSVYVVGVVWQQWVTRISVERFYQFALQWMIAPADMVFMCMYGLVFILQMFIMIGLVQALLSVVLKSFEYFMTFVRIMSTVVTVALIIVAISLNVPVLRGYVFDLLKQILYLVY